MTTTPRMQSMVLAEEALPRPRELEQLLGRAQRDNPILALSIRRGDGTTLGGIGSTNFSDFVTGSAASSRADRRAISVSDMG